MTGRPGGKVVVNRAMSLDGYVAGPGDTIDWVFDHLVAGELPESSAATGAFLSGRRTYEVGRRDAEKNRGAFEGGKWTGPPAFVLTHRPPADAQDTGVTFLTQDIDTAVAIARDAAGGQNLEVLGTDVTGQCLERGLVDEILVHILPVLLGGGTPLLSGPGLGPIALEPTSTSRSGQVTILRFRVLRRVAGPGAMV